MSSSNEYALGHADPELERLESQSRFLGELSEHLLLLAGLRPGMRVVDAGCGPGDLSFLAGRIVGPSGSVLGFDQAPKAIEVASGRARSADVANVRFAVGDASTFVPEAPVDAVIGRLVVMYWPEPVRTLRHLARSVVPGGVIAFLEGDLEAAKSEPQCPLYEATLDRIRETFTRAGLEIRMGLKLGRLFEDAGLSNPRMRSTTPVERGPASNAYHHATEIARTLLPLMERTGVAAASAVDIDTLEDRLRTEATRLRATLVAPALVGVWAKVTDRGEHESALPR